MKDERLRKCIFSPDYTQIQEVLSIERSMLFGWIIDFTTTYAPDVILWTYLRGDAYPDETAVYKYFLERMKG